MILKYFSSIINNKKYRKINKLVFTSILQYKKSKIYIIIPFPPVVKLSVKGIGLPANSTLLVTRPSNTSLVPQTTMATSEPIRILITLPYLFDNTRKFSCAFKPSWCKFPIIGNGIGPGGNDELLRRKWVTYVEKQINEKAIHMTTTISSIILHISVRLMLYISIS